MSETSKKILLGAAASGRVPNAYLFAGNNAVSLLKEAVSFSALLNGEPDTCRVENRLHPDVLIISPDKSIKIDDVRQITEYTRFGPANSKWKIVIIENIDLMTEEAANSFLKTLEEPLANILFILTTTRESKLLRTIISRCQKLSFFDEELLPDENAKAAAEELISVSKMDIPQALKYSEELSGSEDLESVLSAAVGVFREKNGAESGKRFLAVKGIFSTIRSLERHANKRLALDNMMLNFREATNN